MTLRSSRRRSPSPRCSVCCSTVTRARCSAISSGVSGPTKRTRCSARCSGSRSRSGPRTTPTVTNARPWLYGIATNLVAKHRRSEARRIHASARLVAQRGPQEDLGDRVAAALDAADALATRRGRGDANSPRASATRSCCSCGRSSATTRSRPRSASRWARFARASTERECESANSTARAGEKSERRLRSAA